MAEHHRIGIEGQSVQHNSRRRHRAELAIEQPDIVAVIDQRPANGQQPERRQMIIGNAAANGRVGNVDQKNTHLALLSKWNGS